MFIQDALCDSFVAKGVCSCSESIWSLKQRSLHKERLRAIFMGYFRGFFCFADHNMGSALTDFGLYSIFSQESCWKIDIGGSWVAIGIP